MSNRNPLTAGAGGTRATDRCESEGDRTASARGGDSEFRGVRYVVVTPARNEEANISDTIQSMASQRFRPSRWVIVNDGSTDGTGAIIDEAAQEYPWMTVIHRPDRGFRKQGGGVIEAFYEGYERIKEEDWNFLVKFDADTSFDDSYFERCIEKFLADSTLGIGGGLICQEVNGELVNESPGDPGFHVRGATKIYRRECWDAIGGLMLAPGWDTIDEFKANMHGWATRTFADVPLRHHREAGGVDGAWRNWVKNGLANYITGYHPFFMAAKCLRRVFQKPRVVAASGLWFGFCSGYLKRTPRVRDPDVIKYVRRQQLRRLMLKSSVYDVQSDKG